MSRAIVESQSNNVKFAFSLMLQFIDVCPEEIWEKKIGGWPVWQQVYHSFTAIDFFIGAPGGVPVKGPAAPEVGNLSVQGETVVPKAEMKTFAEAAKSATYSYLDSLADADLAGSAEGATKRMGRETTNANVVALLFGHMMYHLGSCDAALRENGLKGVF